MFYLLSADYFVGIGQSTYLFYDACKISVSNTALTRCINSFVVAILLITIYDSDFSFLSDPGFPTF